MPHVLKRELRPAAALTPLRIGQPPGRRASVDYGAILDRVETRMNDLLAWLSALGERALGLAEELSRLPDEAARRRRVRELARVEPWEVAAALLGVASRLARREPVRAGALAALAIVAAEEIAPGAPFPRSEILGRAEALLGDTLRRAGRFREATEACARSAAHLAVTTAATTATTETSLSLYCRLLARARGVYGPLGESLARFDCAASWLDSPDL